MSEPIYKNGKKLAINVPTSVANKMEAESKLENRLKDMTPEQRKKLATLNSAPAQAGIGTFFTDLFRNIFS
jgi:hypothetical protein